MKLPMRSHRDIALVADLKRRRDTVLKEINDLHDRRARPNHGIEDVLARERQRIARELHDGIAQEVTAFLLELEACRSSLSATNPPEADRLATSIMQGRTSLNGLRQLIGRLRANSESDRLLARLRPIIDRHILLGGRVPTVESDGLPTVVPAATQEAIGAVVGEALTNCRRHAPGEAIRIAVCYADDTVTIAIDDTGPGFPEKPDPRRLASEGHFGLLGIRERAVEAGLKVTFGRALGGGARVLVQSRARN